MPSARLERARRGRASGPARATTPPATAINVQASTKPDNGSPGGAASSSATSAAMPSTAPIWRTHASTALPVAKRAGGSSATAALPHEANDSPTPAPVSSVGPR